jgi:hypothetical protein
MITFFEHLSTCPLNPGDKCKVLAGYAKTPIEIITKFPEVYHNIPIMTEVTVISTEENAVTVEAKVSEVRKIVQILERNDLIFIANQLN